MNEIRARTGSTFCPAPSSSDAGESSGVDTRGILVNLGKYLSSRLGCVSEELDTWSELGTPTWIFLNLENIWPRASLG